MQPRYLLLLAVLLCTCGNAAPVTTTPEPATPAAVQATTSAVFDPGDCAFVSAAKLAELLGGGVSEVTEVERSFVPAGVCVKDFEVTLTDDRKYVMRFDVAPISAADIAKETRSFENDARDVPGLIRYEPSAAPGTYLGTHESQRRLYVLNPEATSLATLTYDDPVLGGSRSSPEDAEVCRQGAIRVLNYLLTN